MAVCNPDKFALQAYWDVDMDTEPESIEEGRAVAELREIFDESVRLRMISDVPLGAFLSGGVDSSAVVASMAMQDKGNPVKTSSIGFDDRRFNELEFAGIVAKQYQH